MNWWQIAIAFVIGWFVGAWMVAFLAYGLEEERERRERETRHRRPWEPYMHAAEEHARRSGGGDALRE